MKKKGRFSVQYRITANFENIDAADRAAARLRVRLGRGCEIRCALCEQEAQAADAAPSVFVLPMSVASDISVPGSDICVLLAAGGAYLDRGESHGFSQSGEASLTLFCDDADAGEASDILRNAGGYFLHTAPAD